MIKISVLQLISICIFYIWCLLPVSASEFFPLHKGDSAIYLNSFNNSVGVSTDKHIAKWLHITNFAGLGPLWVKTSSENEQIFVRDDMGSNRELFVDFDNPVGTKTEINISPCNIGTVEIARKDEVISVPAGIFDNVIRLDLKSSCADGGVTSVWFANQIGIVKWESLNIAGSITHEMVQSKIGNSSFPKGIEVNATFPEPVIAIDLEPQADLGKPAKTVDVFIIVKNNTDNELKYIFNSGQRFEILLFDENNNVVSQWSRGRAFTEAIEILSLKQGNILSFGGPIELSDDNDNVLPGGNYTLRIELTTSPDIDSDHKPGSERIGATAPLTILQAL